MKIEYVGPSPEVVIIVEGGGIFAAHGVPVDVPTALGESLIAGDTFKKSKTKADPAASVIAASPQED